jgi:hypothetical protein
MRPSTLQLRWERRASSSAGELTGSGWQVSSHRVWLAGAACWHGQVRDGHITRGMLKHTAATAPDGASASQWLGSQASICAPALASPSMATLPAVSCQLVPRDGAACCCIAITHMLQRPPSPLMDPQLPCTCTCTALRCTGTTATPSARLPTSSTRGMALQRGPLPTACQPSGWTEATRARCSMPPALRGRWLQAAGGLCWWRR